MSFLMLIHAHAHAKQYTEYEVVCHLVLIITVEEFNVLSNVFSYKEAALECLYIYRWLCTVHKLSSLYSDNQTDSICMSSQT